MKRFWKMSLAVLLISAVSAPAFAWEFTMTGEWEYRMRYIGRTGGTDLFGRSDLQNAFVPNPAGGAPGTPLGSNAGIGLAGPNIYNRSPAGTSPVNGSNLPTGPTAVTGAFLSDTSNAGSSHNGSILMPFNMPQLPPAGLGGTIPLLTAVPHQVKIVRGGYSRTQSDAFWTDLRLTFRPVIKLNEAIRVHGVYNVGGYRHKYWQAVGGQGIPPFERYYMSQTSNSAYDTAAVGSWEQFRATIQLPIAVLSLGVKDFPFGTGATLGYNTRAEAFLTVVPYGPFRFLHGLWLSRGIIGNQESWATSPDSQSRNTLFQGVLATYESGPLAWGGGVIWRQNHINRNELTFTNWVGAEVAGLIAPIIAPIPVAPGLFAGVPRAMDINQMVYLSYFKYNSGRFFANAEYAWATVDFYRPGIAPRFDETYHWWMELGTFTGPAKVSLLWSIASGNVLNNGNVTKNYRPWPINYQAMEAYQFLMFETFAGGNNGGWNGNDVSFVQDEKGMMSDAFCYAGRVDYAVASNLNVFGSYLWAHRLETFGTWKGHYTSDGLDTRTLGAAGAANRAAFVVLNWGAPVGFINPFVSDGFLGWEVNLGMSWKLLEGLNLNFRYSYWKPGEYFDEAYQGIGMAGGALVANARVAGKDPIQAITGSMVIDF
jgi:hypothetical protein